MMENPIISENVKVQELHVNFLQAIEKIEILIKNLTIKKMALDVAKISSEKIEVFNHLAVNKVLVSIPIGVIVPFASNNPIPAGWLLCDGREYDVTIYYKLYEILGSKKILPDLNKKLVKFEKNNEIGSTSGKSSIQLNQSNFKKQGWSSSKNIRYEVANDGSNLLRSDKGYHCFHFPRMGSKQININSGNSNIKPIDITPPHLKMRYIIKAL